MQVLLIEDDEADALVFRRQLDAESDIEIEAEACLAKGIERANRDAFDLVALDLDLPDSRGIETLHAFLENVPSPPAVVLLTGQDSRTLALEAVQAGAQDYVRKGSVDRTLLAQVLRHSLERHHMAQELMAAHERVRFLATHCPLTGLPNRYLFQDRLATALDAAARVGATPAVLFLDLNGFKEINDRLGHAAGDEVLRVVAERLQQSVRKSDTAARLGGDEFTVLVTGSPDAVAASRLASKIATAVSRPIAVRNRSVSVRAAIGVAFFPEDGSTAQSLLRNADAAMYMAKQRGEAHRFWAGARQHSARERMDFEEDLSQAVERNEIEVYYQPRVEGSTGRVTGVDALARWQRKDHGWVAPGDFIPVAEANGQILQLGFGIFRDACRMQSEWVAEGIAGGPIAVNVSPIQLSHPDFLSSVTEYLRTEGLRGDALELEVKEECFGQNDWGIVATLEALRRMGVRVTLDDFGCGYSSLGRLAMLPVDQLKIDRRCFESAPGDPGQLRTSKALLALGEALGFAVIAQRVERDSERRFLLESNCKQMQGFLFAKPMPAADMTALLRKRMQPGTSRREREDDRA